MVVCNICGSSEFRDFAGRPGAMCVSCRSFERTRCMYLVLFGRNLVAPGARVLHFAPEHGLAQRIGAVPSVRYEPRDIDPAQYKTVTGVEKFDLARDTESLPSDTYDLILHSHVIEHIRCDVTATLFHLHRAIKPGGAHVFAIPIIHGHYAENLTPDPALLKTQFGQHDHVRQYGYVDLPMTIGKVYPLPYDYDLAREFGEDTLRSANIPVNAWRGLTGNTVFVMRKGDIKLQ